MKTLLLLSVSAALLTGCCIPKRHHHAKCDHDRVTPLPNYSGGSPAPVVTDKPAPVVGGPASSTVATDGETRLELKTEDFAVKKETVSGGAARIRKYVVTETKSVPVVVCHEDFVVERVPAGGAPATPWGPGETVIELPLTREVAVPVITPRVVEVLRVRKTVDCVTNTISATIRTEKADVSR